MLCKTCSKFCQLSRKLAVSYHLNCFKNMFKLRLFLESKNVIFIKEKEDISY